MIELPPFATERDFERCKEIVKKIFMNKKISCDNEDFVNEKTIELMNVIYGTGGGYNDEMYEQYGKAYFSKKSI